MPAPVDSMPAGNTAQARAPLLTAALPKEPAAPEATPETIQHAELHAAQLPSPGGLESSTGAHAPSKAAEDGAEEGSAIDGASEYQHDSGQESESHSTSQTTVTHDELLPEPQLQPVSQLKSARTQLNALLMEVHMSVQRRLPREKLLPFRVRPCWYSLRQ